MKATVVTANRCPFSGNSCFSIDKKMVFQEHKSETSYTGYVFVCPFFKVTNDSVEEFDGYCTIASMVESRIGEELGDGHEGVNA